MSNPRPFPRRLATGVLVACTFAALAACRQDAPAANGAAPAPAPSASAGSVAPAPADASAAVRAAYRKFLALKRYRATMSDAASGKETGTMEFVAPDRYRMRMGPAMEQVRIGDELYTTMGGKTMHSKAGADMPNPKEAGEKMLDAMNSAKVEAAGRDTVEGEPARVYRVTLTEPAPGESTLWVSERSGLPLKSETKIPGTPMQARIVYSDHDDPAIAIEAPKAQ